MSTARHQLAGAPGTGTTIDNMSSRVKAKARILWPSGVPTLQEGLNVTSVGDIAIGQSRFNYTAPLTSLGIVTGACRISGAYSSMQVETAGTNGSYATAMYWGNVAGTFNYYDMEYASFANHGDLA